MRTTPPTTTTTTTTAPPPFMSILAGEYWTDCYCRMEWVLGAGTYSIHATIFDMEDPAVKSFETVTKSPLPSFR